LILPLVVEQILSMLVGMVDTVMVSYAGEAAISGVALVDMINYLFITVFAAIATGGAVIVSQYLGDRQEQQANLAASQLYTISLLISGVIAAVCLLGHRQILNLLYGSVEADVMAASITYFAITALSFPFLGIYNAAAALFRSMKKTNVTMYVSLLMNAINVVGNAIGIFVLKAGVAGVAVPTLIARAVAAIAMTVLALNAKNPVSIQPRDVFSWHSGMIRRILNIAIPNGVENGLFALGKVLVVSIIHGSRTEIPSGDSRFYKGDSLVVVTSGRGVLRQLNDIFA
jgi:Na+-driven multidrug efflux pump